MHTSKSSLAVIAVTATVVSMLLASPAHAADESPGLETGAADVWEPGDSAPVEQIRADDDTELGFDPRDGSRNLPAPPEDAQRRAPSGTVAAAPGLGELPWFSFQDFPLSTDSTARVNIANGNLLVKSTDLSITAPGTPLRFDRYYNGLSTREGTFGGGWEANTPRDVGLVLGSGFVDFYAPSGAVQRFTPIASSNGFTSPAGSNSTLATDSGSTDARYVLTMNRTGEKYFFSAAGKWTRSTDRNGVGIDYSASEFSAGAVHDNDRYINVRYHDGAPGVESVSDSAGRTVSYRTNAMPGWGWGLIEVEVEQGIYKNYRYDSVGRLSDASVDDGGSHFSHLQFEYDSRHRVTKVIEATGVETTFAYSSGQTIVSDANGHKSTYSIDSSGRVATARDALNRSRTQEWNSNNDVLSTTDAAGIADKTYTYDGSNNVTGATLPTGAAASAAYAIGVNCSAPNTGTAYQPKCSTDAAGNKKQHEYDAVGNAVRQTDVTGSTPVTEFERTYGSCGGFAGQVCKTTDGNGKSTAYQYNAKGDLTRVTPPAPLGATSYAYDSLGRVTSVTDGRGDTTTYRYDVRDNLVKTTFNNSQTVTSTYDPTGYERSRTDSAGGKATYDYDSRGRMTRQTGPLTGATSSFTYDKVGNLLTSTDGTGTTTYTYDAANQLTTLRENGGTCPTSGAPASNSGCLTFEYDVNGTETKRTLPGGATTVTARDASSRPTRITAKTGTGSTAVDIGYSYATASGGDRATVQTRTSYAEQGIPAGAVTSYTYDSRNRLTRAEEKAGSAASASWAYSYDNAGNRTKQVRAGNTGSSAGTTTYAYNSANLLTSATGQTTSWTYDGAGNQTRNGLTGVTSSYGDRGQVTAMGGTAATSFGVGNTDRVGFGAARFPSSALGITQRTVSSPQAYTRDPSGGAIGFKAANRWYYVHDHLGSVVGVFSSSGSFSGGYSYSPYGEARGTGTSAAVTTNPLRYIGGYHDGNGIYKLGARYYDTSLGRFTQMDPTGQELNPYAYANCNPINSVDPTGTASACAVTGLVLASVGFVASVTGAIAGLAAAPVTGGTSVAATVAGISTAVGIITGGPGVVIGIAGVMGVC